MGGRAGGQAGDTRAKRLRMRKVSIFKIAVANANFTTRTPFFELKLNFISIHWSFSLFALTELSDMMTKTATMATAKCCQSERDFRLWRKEESMWCKREEL